MNRITTVVLLATLAACSTAPSFANVAAEVPELVECPPADASRAVTLVKRWHADRATVEQELITQIKSGPEGAALTVCQVRDVYALGEKIGEAYTRAREALTELRALPK